MLGVHLVLVTLHGRIPINMEQDNRIGDTKCNIQCSPDLMLLSVDNGDEQIMLQSKQLHGTSQLLLKAKVACAEVIDHPSAHHRSSSDVHKAWGKCSVWAPRGPYK